MAPLPSNNTDVLFLDYTTSGESHTLQLRFDTHASVSDAMTSMDLFLTAVDPLIYVLTVVTARHRAFNSTVSLPVAWSGAATYGSGAGPHYASADYVDFVGRSQNGRRVRAAVFGAISNADTSGNDFRFASSANADVAAAVAELNAPSDRWLAIDNFKPTWYAYGNLGNNAYWRNRIR